MRDTRALLDAMASATTAGEQEDATLRLKASAAQKLNPTHADTVKIGVPARWVLEVTERLWAEGAAAERARLLNTPELRDFSTAVTLEALHQRERWGSDHDAGKAPEDWFWLLGYLGGKALAAAKAGDREKALHHTISSAAALANWHAALLGAETKMRPGIEPPAQESGQ